MGDRVEEKKKRKREALLVSAFELFTEKGINDTSISDIVRRAKMAKGTFYLYFKDKYDIRDKLILHKANCIFVKADEQLRKSDIDGFEEKICFIVDNVVNQLNDNKVLLKFISKNLSWAIFSNIRIPDRDNRNCMDIFKELMRDSGRKFRDEDLMIYLIVEIVSASCYSVILFDSPCSLEQLLRELDQSVRALIKQFEIEEK